MAVSKAMTINIDQESFLMGRTTKYLENIDLWDWTEKLIYLDIEIIASEIVGLPISGS